MRTWKQPVAVGWKFARLLRYWLWGILNRLPPGRFKKIGSRVRFNGWIRFEKPSSAVSIGDDSMIGIGCYFLVGDGGSINIGRNVGINDHCYLTSLYEIEIQDQVIIGELVSIRDYDHAFADVDLPVSEQGYQGGKIVVGRGSWIGRGVMITSGVSIGEGCVIGANAVVTKDIPAWSIAVGAPARVIRVRKANQYHLES